MSTPVAVTTLKTEGNTAFAKQQYFVAIEKYSQAIDIDSKNVACYSNRSAAYLKIKQYYKALNDACKCIEIDPNFIKGHYRKGISLMRLGRYDEAITEMKQNVGNMATNHWTFCQERMDNKMVMVQYEILNTPKMGIDYNLQYGNPLYYKDKNNKQWLLFVIKESLKSVVYRYDIDNDIFSKFTEYYHTFDTGDRCDEYNALSIQNNALYIFGERGRMLMYDFDAKKWRYELYDEQTNYQIKDSISFLIKTGKYVAAVTDIDGIFHRFQFDNNIFHGAVKSIYVKSLNQLWIFPCHHYYSKNLLYIDISKVKDNKDNHIEDVMVIHDCKLPFEADLSIRSRDVFWPILGFDYLIFLFHGDLLPGNKEIWCLDLLGNQMIKCKYHFPDTFEECRAIKTNDNYVYFTNVNWRKTKRFMIRISLYDLIPDETIKSFTKTFQFLVLGFMKKMRKHGILDQHFPSELNDLILFYFPLFV